MERSLAQLRSLGYTCAKVEHWNSYARLRQDLFGFGDILAIKPGSIVIVQVTTRQNHNSRRTKIQVEPRSAIWKSAGGLILLQSWGHKGKIGKRKRWESTDEWL